ncbi:MAG: aminoacyl-histidine dipeptidase, partial [Sedimentibacter sp.]
MERVLEGLKPEKVFYYFEEITKIPRGSGNEKQISDYLFNLARNKGWEVFQDDSLNIIIKKPATIGYENVPGVMLQGHMDMV